MLMPPQTASLLAPDDPALAETLNGASAHPLALVCEHAGQAIPGSLLGDLGVSRAMLDSHIGWDIGAAAVARHLAARLGAPTGLQPYSRLVIHCNRPPEAPDAVPDVSDGVAVPGNRGAVRRLARVAEIFDRFHAEVARIAAHPSRQTIVAIHSFTPEMNGVARPWQIGLLYRRDAQSAGRLAAMLAARPPMLLVGMNQPYAIDDLSDWFLPQHGEGTGLPHCLIEIRNDLVADEAGQADWAELLHSLLDEFVGGAAMTLTREVPLDPAQSAVLFIDVQNFSAHRRGGEWTDLSPEAFEGKVGWFFGEFEARVLPNMQRLQAEARQARVEVLYTTIESLTRDGRDRSLDYKITGFNVPRGSWDGKVLDAIAPDADEIVLPKSSSSVFISTNIDYLLRNLGIRQLVISGLVTDQCVESAIRDACDLGYLVTHVTDACLTYSPERQENSLHTIRGYCRQVTTEALIQELREVAA